MNQIIKILLILALLLGLAYGGSRYIPDMIQSHAIEVIEAGDSASIQTGEKDSFRTLTKGELLSSGTTLRSGDSGQVTLQLSNGGTLVVEPGSEMLLKAATVDRTVFQLKYGKLKADITQYNNRVVEIQGSKPNIRVQTQKASFVVADDGNGFLGINTIDGQVNVLNGNAPPRILKAGEGGLASPEGAFSDFSEGERAMLLKVKWPEAAGAGDKVLVKGKTNLGSEVRVEGVKVMVATDGSFEANLPIPESGSLSVSSRSVLGDQERISPSLLATPTEIPMTPTPSPRPTPKRPPIHVKHGGDWN